jgi:hypothetical protein
MISHMDRGVTLICVGRQLSLLLLAGFHAGHVCGEDAMEGAIPAPGLEESSLVAPLTDAYSRIDPAKDGWSTEAFSEAIRVQLQPIEAALSGTGNAAGVADCPSSSLWPETRSTTYQDGPFRVARITGPFELSKAFPAQLNRLRAAFPDAAEAHLKVVEIDTNSTAWATRFELDLKGQKQSVLRQWVAHWNVTWNPGTPPTLRSVRLADGTLTELESPQPAFQDIGSALFDHDSKVADHRNRSTDYWRRRLPRDFGLDVVANHGIAVGDINGDHLEDLYLCQQGGLPNRLFVRQPDGTFVDRAAESGVDWLDYTTAALLLDFDNDGDRDIALAQDDHLLLQANDGSGLFTAPVAIPLGAQTFSLTAADFDRDGDLDLYTCGYNPLAGARRTSAMGEPVPFHDAENGGPNHLLRNEGDLRFTDITAAVGLEANNRRYSFAAAWEDFDRDGDPDLYVANDYGRNNLYRNDEGVFTDIAAELGVEDQSAGMSVCWGDYNRDGRRDVYVSNMFSSAGRRITYQSGFKPAADADTRARFQRFSRGNTLFAGNSNCFHDVSVDADVYRGRWAWGSLFCDINNDGWEDLLVANGFVTTSDSGDL